MKRTTVLSNGAYAYVEAGKPGGGAFLYFCQKETLAIEISEIAATPGKL